MLKKSLLFIAAVMAAQGVFADTLSPDQALQRAQANAPRKLASIVAKPSLAFTAKTKTGDPALYVFNQADNGGFMVISADDVAVPMLGYTDNGAFDPANIPPQFSYWMDEYAGQIAYAKENGLAYETKDLSQSFPSSWTPIDPMLKTNWDQNTPYNLYTPEVGNSHTPTGCVATAMAQVMKYWQYPAKNGSGQISYYCDTKDVKKQMTMTFDRQPALDWSNMLDNYVSGRYNQTQAEAVANLMVQCGYSVSMGYALAGSGTQSELIGSALITYFGYNKGITVQQRLPYTASEWNELCYSQLKIGPVIYGGTSMSAGHCFVMDGYDGNGYFHFNWGWSGVSNGYFLLNALNPSAQGTGSSYGGYNMNQAIIAGVQPDYSDPVSQNPLSLSLNCSVMATYTTTSRVMAFTFTGVESPSLANDCMYSFRPELAVEFMKEDGSGTPVYVNFPINFSNMPPGSFVSPRDTYRITVPSTLGDGTYKVRLVSRKYGESKWNYLYIIPGNYDYVIFKKIGSSASVQNMTPQRFNITGAEITTPLYYNNPCILELSVENPNGMELTQSLVPYLYKNGSPMYMCENRLITVDANSTAKVEINCDFLQFNGATTPQVGTPVDFDLVLIDYLTGDIYGNFGTVSMKRSGSNASLRARNFTISNAEDRFMVEGVGNVYGISNFNNINIEFTLEAQNGFVSSPIVAIVSEYDPSSAQVGAQIYEQQIEDMVYMESGESIPVSTTINYHDFDISQMYQMAIYYTKSGSRMQLALLRFAASTGVEEVFAGEDGLSISYSPETIYAASEAGIVSIEVYDSKGAKVMAGTSGQLGISSLGHGLYIVRATDGNGNAKVIKIVK